MKEAINFMIGEESVRSKSDALIPEPYSDEEYEKLHEFILVLRPLAILTDRFQKDGIVSPDVIPDILECYLGKFATHLLYCTKKYVTTILICIVCLGINKFVG